MKRGILHDDSDLELKSDGIAALPIICVVNEFVKDQCDDLDVEVECEMTIAGAYATLPTSPGPDGDAWRRPLAESAYRGHVRVMEALLSE